MKLLKIITLCLMLCSSLGVHALDTNWTAGHEEAEKTIHSKNISEFKKIFRVLKNPEANDNTGYSLLSSAVLFDANEIVIWMLDNGVSPNDNSKESPLNIAIRTSNTGDFEIIKTLIAAGADINSKGIFGMSPLHMAKLSELELIDYLLVNGALPNQKLDNGQTALHVFSGHIGDDAETIKLLISYGATSTIDNDGNTPLHLMIGAWIGDTSVEVAKLLINSGSNPEAKNNNGQTAWDILKARDNYEQTFPELINFFEKINEYSKETNVLRKGPESTDKRLMYFKNNRLMIFSGLFIILCLVGFLLRRKSQ